MEQLKSLEQFNELKNSGKHIFMFTANWCPDCRVIEPFLPELINDYPEYKFISINRDDFIEIAQQYDIFGIPSFLAFKDGEELGRFVSKARKTKEEIEQFITQLK